MRTSTSAMLAVDVTPCCRRSRLRPVPADHVGAAARVRPRRWRPSGCAVRSMFGEPQTTSTVEGGGVVCAVCAGVRRLGVGSTAVVRAVAHSGDASTPCAEGRRVGPAAPSGAGGRGRPVACDRFRSGARVRPDPHRLVRRHAAGPAAAAVHGAAAHPGRGGRAHADPHRRPGGDLAAARHDDTGPGLRRRVPRPTIVAAPGRETVLRLVNQHHHGLALHLHGGHTAAEHDGHPLDLVAPGAERTYRYPNGQRPATLWYHDHAMMATAPNVYRGLAGLYLIGDPREAALGLPVGGPTDIPLVLTDRTFDADGQLVYPDGSHDGVVVDAVSRLDEVERWRLTNTAPGSHPLHLHQRMVLVRARRSASSGAPQPFAPSPRPWAARCF
ncbi:MAG TPA: multicopper oxidase domain-containing protein [Euzebya sp.]|nr:multicopper oxidase domain-containing protein [Euzebya sp.]